MLLALLASLPPELQALPHSAPLRRHLRGSFSALSAPQSPPRPNSPPPKSPWRAMGLCPLNPFLVPLWLLRAPPPNPINAEFNPKTAVVLWWGGLGSTLGTKNGPMDPKMGPGGVGEA